MVSLLQRVTFSKRRKSNQKGLPLAYGLRCAQVPSLRSRSVGTPPRAIHGPSRLSRHPCRSTHYTEPPLGLPMGQADQNQKPTQKQIQSRSKADPKQIQSRSKADPKQIQSRLKTGALVARLFCPGLGIEPECSYLLREAMATGPRLTPTVC